LILDGELYNHAFKDDFNSIISACKKQTPTEEEKAKARDVIQYHVYDVPSEDRFADRIDYLHILPFVSEYLHKVETLMIDIDHVDEFAGSFIEDGYEGAMVRLNAPYENKRSKSLIKWKEMTDEEFPIIEVLEGDLIVAGGQIFVASGAVIDGDVVIFGGTIVMDAQVGKSLKIYGGDVTLGGSVQGPAEIRAEKATLNGTINGESILAIQNLSLGENASFTENVRYWTKEGETDFAPTLERDATAEFDTTLGPKVNSDTWEQAAVAGGALAVVFGVYSLLSSALILLLLLLLARPLFKRAGDRVRAEPWWSLLIGFLYVAVMPVLILLLFVTLIGIPLALFTLFLYIFSWVFGTVISAMKRRP
jgi:cytoskeletal protein CcmA (bactofilin family)